MTVRLMASIDIPNTAHPMNTFWVPYAFRNSPFLNHYQQIFAAPDVVVPLFSGSGRELKSLALERSLETIHCVETRLASPDVSCATSNTVLEAVTAIVCYNVSFTRMTQLLHNLGDCCAAELTKPVHQS